MGPTSYATGGVIQSEPHSDAGNRAVPTLRQYSGKLTLTRRGDDGKSFRALRRHLRAAKRAARTDHRETDYGRVILAGLQSKHVYQGSVPEDEVQRRRTTNRRAKASRKANR